MPEPSVQEVKVHTLYHFVAVSLVVLLVVGYQARVQHLASVRDGYSNRMTSYASLRENAVELASTTTLLGTIEPLRGRKDDTDAVTHRAKGLLKANSQLLGEIQKAQQPDSIELQLVPQLVESHAALARVTERQLLVQDGHLQNPLVRHLELQSALDKVLVLARNQELRLRSRSSEVSAELAQTSLIFNILISASLLIESFLLFFPMTRRLNAMVQKLLAQQSDLESRNADLAKVETRLQDQNQQLWESQAQLEQAMREQMMANELLRLASQRFQELFHGVPFACFSVDREYRVFEWNAQCQNDFGHAAFMVFEQSIFEFAIPQSSAEDWTNWLNAALEGERVSSVETTVMKLDGTEVPVLTSIFPIRAANDAVTGAIIAAADMTDRKSALDQLSLFRHVVEQSTTGIVITDTEQHILFANPTTCSITGYSLEELVGAKPSKLLHGPETDSAVRDLMRSKIAQGENFQIEVLNYRKDKTPYWVQLQIDAVRDPSGKITHYVAIQQDITQRKQEQEALALQEERFRVGMSILEAGVFILDKEGNIEFASEPACAILMANEEQLLGRNIYDLGGDPIDFHGNPYRCEALELLKEGTPFDEVQSNIVGFLRADGVRLWLSVKTGQIWNADKTAATGLLLTFQDITALVSLQSQLQSHHRVNVPAQPEVITPSTPESFLVHAATTDTLTGLENYRAFREALGCLEVTQQLASILIIDIDRFKLYNETYGNAAGDQLLNRMGRMLESLVRRGEALIARYGGEEFAVLLYDAGIADAKQLAHRIADKVRAEDWDGRPVTVSIGICTTQFEGMTSAEAIEEAHQAVYECKRLGRNSVVHACDLTDRDYRVA